MNGLNRPSTPNSSERTDIAGATSSTSFAGPMPSPTALFLAPHRGKLAEALHGLVGNRWLAMEGDEAAVDCLTREAVDNGAMRMGIGDVMHQLKRESDCESRESELRTALSFPFLAHSRSVIPLLQPVLGRASEHTALLSALTNPLRSYAGVDSASGQKMPALNFPNIPQLEVSDDAPGASRHHRPRQRHPVIVLSGVAGIGKSCLAASVCRHPDAQHLAGKFAERVHWVDCSDGVTDEETLALFIARTFSRVAIGGFRGRGLWSDVRRDRQSVADAAYLFRDYGEQSSLLVLDSFEKISVPVCAVLGRLAEVTTIIVITREEALGSSLENTVFISINLGGLLLDLSRRLWQSFGDVSISPPQLDLLQKLARGHPLALKILHAEITARGSAKDLVMAYHERLESHYMGTPNPAASNTSTDSNLSLKAAVDVCFGRVKHFDNGRACDILLAAASTLKFVVQACTWDPVVARGLPKSAIDQGGGRGKSEILMEQTSALSLGSPQPPQIAQQPRTPVLDQRGEPGVAELLMEQAPAFFVRSDSFELHRAVLDVLGSHEISEAALALRQSFELTAQLQIADRFAIYDTSDGSGPYRSSLNDYVEYHDARSNIERFCGNFGLAAWHQYISARFTAEWVDDDQRSYNELRLAVVYAEDAGDARSALVCDALSEGVIGAAWLEKDEEVEAHQHHLKAAALWQGLGIEPEAKQSDAHALEAAARQAARNGKSAEAVKFSEEGARLWREVGKEESALACDARAEQAKSNAASAMDPPQLEDARDALKAEARVWHKMAKLDGSGIHLTLSPLSTPIDDARVTLPFDEGSVLVGASMSPRLLRSLSPWTIRFRMRRNSARLIALEANATKAEATAEAIQASLNSNADVSQMGISCKALSGALNAKHLLMNDDSSAAAIELEVAEGLVRAGGLCNRDELPYYRLLRIELEADLAAERNAEFSIILGYLEEAQRLWTQFPDCEDMVRRCGARIIGSRVKDAIARGSYREGVGFAEEAVQAWRQLRDYESTALLYEALREDCSARLAAWDGDLEREIAHREKTAWWYRLAAWEYPLAKEEECKVAALRSEIAEREGDLGEAIRYANEARSLSRELKNRNGEAIQKCRRDILYGHLERGKSNPRVAVTYYDGASRMFGFEPESSPGNRLSLLAAGYEAQTYGEMARGSPAASILFERAALHFRSVSESAAADRNEESAVEARALEDLSFGDYALASAGFGKLEDIAISTKDFERVGLFRSQKLYSMGLDCAQAGDLEGAVEALGRAGKALVPPEYFMVQRNKADTCKKAVEAYIALGEHEWEKAGMLLRQVASLAEETWRRERTPDVANVFVAIMCAEVSEACVRQDMICAADLIQEAVKFGRQMNLHPSFVGLLLHLMDFVQSALGRNNLEVVQQPDNSFQCRKVIIVLTLLSLAIALCIKACGF